MGIIYSAYLSLFLVVQYFTIIFAALKDIGHDEGPGGGDGVSAGLDYTQIMQWVTPLIEQTVEHNLSKDRVSLTESEKSSIIDSLNPALVQAAETVIMGMPKDKFSLSESDKAVVLGWIKPSLQTFVKDAVSALPPAQLSEADKDQFLAWVKPIITDLVQAAVDDISFTMSEQDADKIIGVLTPSIRKQIESCFGSKKTSLGEADKPFVGSVLRQMLPVLIKDEVKGAIMDILGDSIVISTLKSKLGHFEGEEDNDEEEEEVDETISGLYNTLFGSDGEPPKKKTRKGKKGSSPGKGTKKAPFTKEQAQLFIEQGNDFLAFEPGNSRAEQIQIATGLQQGIMKTKHKAVGESGVLEFFQAMCEINPQLDPNPKPLSVRAVTLRGDVIEGVSRVVGQYAEVCTLSGKGSLLLHVILKQYTFWQTSLIIPLSL